MLFPTLSKEEIPGKIPKQLLKHYLSSLTKSQGTKTARASPG